MLTAMFVVAGLIGQTNSIGTGPGGQPEESAWSHLGREDKCGLVRSILDTSRTKPPKYCLLHSECIRRLATLEGRLLVNVGVRWDVNGVKQLASFPDKKDSQNSTDQICGRSDVIFQNGAKPEQRKKGNGLWQLGISLYPIGDPGMARFAFWAQLEPTWRLPPSRAAFSGCPAEYGFAQLVDGKWSVEFDPAARSYVPIAPALKAQTPK